MDLNLMLPIIVIAVILSILKIVFRSKAFTTRTVFLKKTHPKAIAHEYPYQKAKALFTPAERSFLGVLDQAVGEKARVFGKIRIADIIEPRKGMSRSNWQKSFNKISSKHFDFLLCRNDDLSPICAVELNDASHSSRPRRERDSFIDILCNKAGLPLIQIPAKASYPLIEIKNLLASHLDFLPTSNHQLNHPMAETELNSKLCPECSSPMIERIARKGKYAGSKFLSCSAYPQCKHIEPMSS